MHSTGGKPISRAQKKVQLHNISAQRGEERKKLFGRALQQNSTK
jgi:hypothetical protein